MRRRWLARTAALLCGAFFACSAAHAANSAAIGKPPSWADPFYAKYVDARGIAIMGSANIDDRALAKAADIVSHMLAKRADLAETMASQHAVVAVIASSELFTDIPEMRQFRGTTSKTGHDMDKGCGGGAVKRNPVTTVCERTLLEEHAKFATLVHEFGHSIQNLALDSETLAAIRTAYQHAQENGLFRKADGQTPAYLMNNEREFFADTSAMWFDGYNTANPHNSPSVATRAELKIYGPEIYGILATIYPNDEWKALKPRS